jgi:hypothetical protein
MGRLYLSEAVVLGEATRDPVRSASMAIEFDAWSRDPVRSASMAIEFDAWSRDPVRSASMAIEFDAWSRHPEERSDEGSRAFWGMAIESGIPPFAAHRIGMTASSPRPRNF